MRKATEEEFLRGREAWLRILHAHPDGLPAIEFVELLMEALRAEVNAGFRDGDANKLCERFGWKPNEMLYPNLPHERDVLQ